MSLNFSKIFESKKPKENREEKDKKIFEEVVIFINNFNQDMAEARVLLESADKNSDQSTLDKIEGCILDMNSNLLQITELFKKTKVGEEYFFTDKSESSDSLKTAEEEILLEGTPFSTYPKMVRDFEAFKTESIKKLVPESSSLEN